MSLEELTERFRPDAHDDVTGKPIEGPNPDWTWDDAAKEFRRQVCDCCGKKGHYQKQIEDLVKQQGIDFANTEDGEPTIQLSYGDGKVLDGHHRIVAALKLGLPDAYVELA